MHGLTACVSRSAFLSCNFEERQPNVTKLTNFENRLFQNRIWQRDQRDHRCIATDPLYAPLVS